MKSRLRKPTSMMAAVCAMAFTGTLLLSSARNAGAHPESPNVQEGELFHGVALVGTWRIKVQLVNCQTRTPVGMPFASLVTFNEGGTLTGSTSNPGFAVGQRSPEQGVWEREGHHTYEAKSVAFIFFATAPNPPINPGFNAGTQTISQSIEFDSNPDEFTSNATIQFFDTTGTSYRQGCASAVAKRFD